MLLGLATGLALVLPAQDAAAQNKVLFEITRPEAVESFALNEWNGTLLVGLRVSAENNQNGQVYGVEIDLPPGAVIGSGLLALTRDYMLTMAPDLALYPEIARAMFNGLPLPSKVQMLTQALQRPMTAEENQRMQQASQNGYYDGYNWSHGLQLTPFEDQRLTAIVAAAIPGTVRQGLPPLPLPLRIYCRASLQLQNYDFASGSADLNGYDCDQVNTALTGGLQANADLTRWQSLTGKVRIAPDLAEAMIREQLTNEVMISFETDLTLNVSAAGGQAQVAAGLSERRNIRLHRMGGYTKPILPLIPLTATTELATAAPAAASPAAAAPVAGAPVAPSAPAAAATAPATPPKPVKRSLVGISLGLPVADALAKMEKTLGGGQTYKATIDTRAKVATTLSPWASFQHATIIDQPKSLISVALHSEPPGAADIVTALTWTQRFAQGKRPLPEDLHAFLIDSYGAPSQDGNGVLIWHATPDTVDGQPIASSTDYANCAGELYSGAADIAVAINLGQMERGNSPGTTNPNEPAWFDDSGDRWARLDTPIVDPTQVFGPIAGCEALGEVMVAWIMTGQDQLADGMHIMLGNPGATGALAAAEKASFAGAVSDVILPAP